MANLEGEGTIRMSDKIPTQRPSLINSKGEISPTNHINEKPRIAEFSPK
jgi:hypothetical protein